jgi:hypothetical protein
MGQHIMKSRLKLFLRLYKSRDKIKKRRDAEGHNSPKDVIFGQLYFQTEIYAKRNL